MEIPKEKLVELLRVMVTIRGFEERVKDLYARGHIPGLAHLYIGEEAVATGICANLTPEDYITSTHRGHGHVIAKGAELKPMMAELYGKATGYCKGKGGSMHIADVHIGILGANGIAGGGLPLAVGAGLSARLRGTDQVVACFFGDDSSNNGTFHEAMNMAAIFRLPVVFVCENNLYGISTPQSYHMAVQDVSVRAAAYNMPGVTIDGNDVRAVFDAGREAVLRARSGEGPTLIECKTYRWRGHHEGDPNQGGRYRDRAEIDEWAARCPIYCFQEKLIEAGILTVETAKAMHDAVEHELDEAVAFAEESPYPDLSAIYEDVYV